MVKGEAESQRLQREELEQELRKIRLQEQSLTTENETFKVSKLITVPVITLMLKFGCFANDLKLFVG